jgi:hypothetical protein
MPEIASKSPGKTHRRPLNPPPKAKLYEAMGDRGSAAHYFRLNLSRLDAEGAAAGSDTVDALLFLAEYCKVGGVCVGGRAGGDWQCIARRGA